MKIELSKETIDEIFNTNTHQHDVALELYKIAFPNWDDIEELDGWPSVSRATGEYIMQRFIHFDREFHPTVINGGLWMNNGFSTLDTDYLEDWVIDTAKVNVKMKGGK